MADPINRDNESKRRGSTMKTVFIALVALLVVIGAMAGVLMMGGGSTTKPSPNMVSLGNPTLGRQVFIRPDVNCIFCHSDDGSNGQGPTMKGMFGGIIKYDDGTTVNLDDTAVRWTLKHPNEKIVEGFEPRMPNDIDTKLSEDDRVNLIAYLRSIGAGTDLKK